MRLNVLGLVQLLPLSRIETFFCTIRVREISRHHLTLCSVYVACTVTVQATGATLHLVALCSPSNDYKHIG